MTWYFWGGLVFQVTRSSTNDSFGAELVLFKGPCWVVLGLLGVLMSQSVLLRMLARIETLYAMAKKTPEGQAYLGFWG